MLLLISSAFLAHAHSFDLATQKISFKKSNMPGVCQFGAESRATFYNKYTDKKGNKRLKLKAKERLAILRSKGRPMGDKC